MILDHDQVLHKACDFTRMLIHRVQERLTDRERGRYGKLHDKARQALQALILELRIPFTPIGVIASLCNYQTSDELN